MSEVAVADPRPEPAPPAFRVTGAVVEYDGRPVLDGVSFEVPRGEVLAILGPNGSGKSTLSRAMLGLVPLHRGGVELHGVPVRRFRQWGRVGYVPQRLPAGGGVPATVREVVASGQVARLRRLRLPGPADRAAVDEALAAVGLADRARDSVHELSGGQQQRVLIARALAGRPDTFVMDEPMAGVDAASQRALAGAVAELRRRGHTVVLVLHELGPLRPLIQRAVVLAHGRIAHDGEPPRPAGEPARPDHDHAPPDAGAPLLAPAVPGLEVPRRD
ncbi:metal ABC transporter ATP-binding protein [Marinitenerispora sediminis]|uniref:ABC transporter ATP-binding protein n=1 Tax=Marinitenerispora sediminis TaxID=1931232 RepID=A0A368T5M2_9ACTN|nr:metal ABC transporter ATP-binding protein [Marinitenerispora sediminis]RCV52718.1 ABC transporter ATP-binding protein [Marinitenerispora sediminis]RCV56067.1 ABC transporter ATP-binding protein [Marinitenerispora sediminis]RCV59001.1 ABC transporter ATP-binding protein [Marinitenerispora sediminis]